MTRSTVRRARARATSGSMRQSCRRRSARCSTPKRHQNRASQFAAVGEAAWDDALMPRFLRPAVRCSPRPRSARRLQRVTSAGTMPIARTVSKLRVAVAAASCACPLRLRCFKRGLARRTFVVPGEKQERAGASQRQPAERGVQQKNHAKKDRRPGRVQQCGRGGTGNEHSQPFDVLDRKRRALIAAL